MPDYHCPARQQLLLLVLAAITIFFVTLAEARNCEPEIITYGDCPGGGQRHPYQIEMPLCPQLPEPKIPEVVRKSYSYKIDDSPEQCSYIGSRLPVMIQNPIHEETPVFHDSLRGRSYGIGIERAPSTPRIIPSRGQYNFGIQQSVPRPERPANPPDLYRVRIQAGPSSPPLWGPLRVNVQHPLQYPSETVRPVPRLTGLMTKIDRILIPHHSPLHKDTPAQGGCSGYDYPESDGNPGGNCRIGVNNHSKNIISDRYPGGNCDSGDHGLWKEGGFSSCS